MQSASRTRLNPAENPMEIRTTPQIVMGAVVIKNFIAHVDPHSNRSPESFRAASGIENAEDIAAIQTIEIACHCVYRDRWTVIDVEVYEPAFRRSENANCGKVETPQRDVYFWTDQSVERSYVGASQGQGAIRIVKASVNKRLRNCSWTRLPTAPAARNETTREPRRLPDRCCCLRELNIVSENSHVDVVQRLGENCWCKQPKKN